MIDWKTRPATDLEAAIAEFKAALPGWWLSVCECQVSSDASCAPTIQSQHIRMIPVDARFNSGFHADLKQPATLADALRDVMVQALAAIAEAVAAMSEGERRRFEDGRRDWRDTDWQDHCGDPNCEQCEGNVIPWGQL